MTADQSPSRAVPVGPAIGNPRLPDPDGGRRVFAGPNAYHIDWINQRHRPALQEATSSVIEAMPNTSIPPTFASLACRGGTITREKPGLLRWRNSSAPKTPCAASTAATIGR